MGFYEGWRIRWTLRFGDDITATKQTTNSAAIIETAPTTALEVVVAAPGSITLSGTGRRLSARNCEKPVG
jgi:hypothetical protein